MKRCVLLAAGALLTSLASAWEHVIPGRLQNVIGMNEYVMVAFVAPSQSASKGLEDQWVKVQNEGVDISRLSIDCEKYPKTCLQYGGVDIADPNAEFPAIILFKDGKIFERYHGPRRADAFLFFCWRARRSPVNVRMAGNRLEKFVDTDEVVFTAFIEEGDTASQEMWEAAVQPYRTEFTFGIITDDAAAKREGVQRPGVMCYKSVNGEVVPMKKPFEPEELKNFIVSASRLVISELTPANHQRFKDRAWPIVYLFGATADERQTLRQDLHKFAKDHYDSLTTVVVDPAQFPDLQEKLGLEPGVFPAGAVHQLSKNRIFPYPKGQTYDTDSLKKWGMDVQSGRVRPWTPPGETMKIDNDDLEIIGVKHKATAKVSILGGDWKDAAKIKVMGRDEL